MKSLTRAGQKVTCLVLFAAVIALTGLYQAGKLQATPADKFTSTTLAVGKFGEIHVFNQSILQDASNPHNKDLWLSMQKTQGTSDVYVQSNVWQPGGSSGWHTHPGHSLITVTAGTVTAYDGHDPSCTPTQYTVGMGFVDPGAGHVHNLRNEGTVEARTITVQLIPARLDGSSSVPDRRIDADDPGNCQF
jgi:uncharacterized cupin superfamily protein